MRLTKNYRKRLFYITLTLFMAWSFILIGSFIWIVYSENHHVRHLALLQAKALVDKDLMYRKWNVDMGTIWADSSQVMPNPYLQQMIKDRDLSTSDGKTLTMINPAYMTRMVFDIQKGRMDISAKITSLKPINPNNMPDAWETQVLKQAEKNHLEFNQLADSEGQVRFRYMRALIAEKPCLSCHEQQGYKLGEIRGGISISIPMAPFYTLLSNTLLVQGGIHYILWMLGVIGIGFGSHSAQRHERARMKSEADLVASHQHIRAIIDSAMDCIVGMDRDGCIIDFNANAEQIFGYRREDVLGRKMSDVIIPPALREKHEIGVKRYLATGKSLSLNKRLELVAINRDGSEFPVELTISEAKGADGQVFFTGFLRDISDRLKAKSRLLEAKMAAERANKSKSAFLANMSHEIRTPLNVVIGMTNLALLDELNDKQRNYISKANYSAKYLLDIINEILDFSKIEADKLEIEEIEFRLNDVITKMMNLIKPKADENDISLVLEIAPEVPVFLKGDPVRLAQVLINLASNAVKFSKKGDSVGITISLEQENESEVILQFSVSDTGIGITKEQKENLFKPFSQADNSTTRQYGGTGLGLVISREIVKILGGEIWLESEPGVGSTFSFTVKMKPAMGAFLQDVSLGEYDVSIVNKALARLNGVKVLLVEDDELNQELACDLLKMGKMLVQVASNGQQALDLLTDHDFDVILMDCQMPVMDGYEATRRIRRQERFNALPVIAMSANAMKADVEKALEVGMSDHIAKPINMDKMFVTIAKWAKHRAPSGDSVTEKTEQKTIGQEAMPGFDPNNTLAQKKPELFKRLLKEFLNKYQDFEQQFRNSQQDQDRQAPMRAAHTLKGTAGTLGMPALQAAAEALEYACKENADTIDEHLNIVLEQLQLVLASLNAIE